MSAQPAVAPTPTAGASLLDAGPPATPAHHSGASDELLAPRTHAELPIIPEGACTGNPALAGEAVVTIFLVLYASLMTFKYPMPTTPILFERDPALSFPLVEDTVSTGRLVALVTLIPCAVVLLGHGTLAWRSRRSAHQRLAVLASLAWVVLSYVQANAAHAAVTYTLKPVLARQRPNYFAYCNYAGYRQATQTGNYTTYFSLTSPGAIGDASKCQGTRKNLYEASASFPSGHASYSFGAFVWTTLYVRTFLGLPWHEHLSLVALLAGSPLVLAAWVSLSRVRDYHHHVDDTLAGAIIGAACACLAWAHYLRTRGRYTRPSLLCCGATMPGDVAPVMTAAPAESPPQVVTVHDNPAARVRVAAGSPPLPTDLRRGPTKSNASTAFDRASAATPHAYSPSPVPGTILTEAGVVISGMNGTAREDDTCVDNALRHASSRLSTTPGSGTPPGGTVGSARRPHHRLLLPDSTVPTEPDAVGSLEALPARPSGSSPSQSGFVLPLTSAQSRELTPVQAF